MKIIKIRSKQKLKKNFYEKTAWLNNNYVCGIDEVGRGSLAGPVVVCACILPINTKANILKDSKLLSKEQRKNAYKWVIENCYYSIGLADHKKIDKFNIYQTTKTMMEKSLIQLINLVPFSNSKLEFILTDAMPLDKNNLYKSFNQKELNENFAAKFHHFAKGETYSKTIAAASIVAKVFRDDLMEKICKIFPAFQFSQHKGYGTKIHLKAIEKHVSIIHRKTFLKKIKNKQNSIDPIQKNLF